MSKKSTTAAKAVTAAAKALESSTFDETFAKFQEVCEDIRNESSHLKKSAVLVTYLDELRKKGKLVLINLLKYLIKKKLNYLQMN